MGFYASEVALEAEQDKAKNKVATELSGVISKAGAT
jgi:hypothetical protein